ncbi:MAG: hypothetical protein QF371_06060, partial [Flavobacteriales bacterium]|nr:hypothetical protein [Flavobacteriales bacterium]
MSPIKHIITILWLVTLVLNSFGQQHTTLVIRQFGDVLSQKKLDKAIRLKKTYPDSNTTVIALNHLIKALHEFGYAEAGIDQIIWKNDTATAQLHAGKRYFFGNINPGNVPKGVLRKVGFKANMF